MPDYPQHFLKENHGSQRPVRILFYDCETKPKRVGKIEYHKMMFGWSYYVRRDNDESMENGKWNLHTRQQDFCDHINTLCKEKTTLYIFTHNAFFDMQASGFFHFMPTKGWVLNFFYDKGLTYILVIRKGKRTIKVLSTTNYFAESLKELGKTFDLPKLDISFKNASRELLITYCHRDVEIIVKIMRRWFEFIDKHDCGSFGMTRASQSFRAFRHRFMEQPISVHKDEDIIELERAAYMGGRTEAFYIGEIKDDEINSYDVNSMYPAIMRDGQFPYQLIDYIENPSLDRVPDYLKLFCVVAEIEVDTKEPAYAVRYNKKIIFPMGQFKTWVCTEGLRYAHQKGHLVGIKAIAFYRKARLFRRYVDYFYPLKQKAKKGDDKIMATMVKIFLNSLYGKFGQKYMVQDIEETADAAEYLRVENLNEATGEITTETHLFNTIITDLEEVNGKNSLVAIAAHITEAGRLQLWRTIQSFREGAVVYCDTDSIYVQGKTVNPTGFTVDNIKLGAWKHEQAIKHIRIYGCKDYVVDGVTKIKGVPKNAVEAKPGTFAYQQFAGQSTHLRQGEDSAFIIRDTNKVNKRIYDKAKVNNDGTTTPWVMVGSELFDPSLCS